MIETLSSYISTFLNGYISQILTALSVSGLFALFLYMRHRTEWRYARFESRINMSLNIIRDGLLLIRTIHESDIGGVILSPHARKLVRKAARATTLEDPFLHFKNELDAWLVYNEIVNSISTIAGTRILSRVAQNTPMPEEPFLIALTWERDTRQPLQKLRVIMTQTSVLQGHALKGVKPVLETHEARIRTLTAMQKQLEAGDWPEHQVVML